MPQKPKSNPYGVIFNPARHEYTKDGIIVPSVTQILRESGIMDMRWATPENLLRGTYAHRATELYDLEILDESTVDPVIRPYLDGWVKFRNKTGVVIEKCEELVFSSRYFYAGHQDKRAFLFEKRTVIDITTGEEFQRAKAVQLAAYQNAYNEHQSVADKIKERMVVQLKSNGDFYLPPPDFYSKNDFNVFLAGMVIVNWRSKNGRK